MHRSIIERAYELARSGEVKDILHIKMRLSAEGHTHIDAHLDGPKIRADLRELIARSTPADLAESAEAPVRRGAGDLFRQPCLKDRWRTRQA